VKLNPEKGAVRENTQKSERPELAGSADSAARETFQKKAGDWLKFGRGSGRAVLWGGW